MLQNRITSNSSTARASRVAQATARPLYWTTAAVDATEHAENLGMLLKWCLGLPNVSLGISTRGICSIIRAVYIQRKDVPSREIDEMLNSQRATEEERR